MEEAASECLTCITNELSALQRAFELVHDNYVDAGLIDPEQHGMRVTEYHLLETTEVLVGFYCGDVIATASLFRDGRLGLPMEAIYENEVHKRRRRRRVAEVGCLATAKSADSRITFVLMRHLAQLASVRGTEELLVTVHPRHAGFYKRFYAFTEIGEQKSHGSVNGAPAVALALDLDKQKMSMEKPKAYSRLFASSIPAKSLERQALPPETRSWIQSVLSGAPERLPAARQRQLEHIVESEISRKEEAASHALTAAPGLYPSEKAK